MVVYNKPGTKITQGEVGTKQATISGLKSGTKVAKGDYQVAYSDGTSESDKVDVPSFTILTPTIPVTGVTLSKETLSLVVGSTDILVATILPENATNEGIVTTSDNEDVATFSPDGKVTAIGKGTANVTVTTIDGGFTATCVVTVTEATLK
ncbi:Ig-like domain-containing protein [Pediococcus pentosaceus]|uniref:Ig-like domain-containing protein n=1 Tax=Pediococcus pentosaceus TaxID=1255 RepID=UPI0031646489